MTFSPRLMTLALAAPLALSAPAFADTTGESIDKCIAEMEAASGAVYADATYDFKNIRGSSTKKLTFDMTSGDMSEKVVCKVRRGNISAIEWPETVIASLEAATEATEETS